MKVTVTPIQKPGKEQGNCRSEEESRLSGISLPTDKKVKLKENKKREKYQDLAREPKKTIGHEREGDTNFNWCDR